MAAMMDDHASARYIKIYGERNSGTTYLQALVAANLDVAILPGVAPRRLRRLFRNNEAVIDLYFRLTTARNLGWKHRIAPAPQELQHAALPASRVLFLIISKNPYAWLLSLFRHPYHYQGELTTFEAFLAQTWRTVGREGHPAPFANPIDMWNAKHASYLQLAQSARCFFIRYEDILSDPESVTIGLSSVHNIPRRAAGFVNVQTSTKGEADRDFDYYRRRYLEELWRDELSKEAIAIINRFLDPVVVDAIGYPMIT